MKEYENITPVTIIATPQAGTSEGKVIADCIRLAADQWCNVEYIFNGTRKRILVNDLIACAKPL